MKSKQALAQLAFDTGESQILTFLCGPKPLLIAMVLL